MLRAIVACATRLAGSAVRRHRLVRRSAGREAGRWRFHVHATQRATRGGRGTQVLLPRRPPVTVLPETTSASASARAGAGASPSPSPSPSASSRSLSVPRALRDIAFYRGASPPAPACSPSVPPAPDLGVFRFSVGSLSAQRTPSVAASSAAALMRAGSLLLCRSTGSPSRPGGHRAAARLPQARAACWNHPPPVPAFASGPTSPRSPRSGLRSDGCPGCPHGPSAATWHRTASRVPGDSPFGSEPNWAEESQTGAPLLGRRAHGTWVFDS